MNALISWPRSTRERPLLIAHRGLPLRHPENSASSLRAARRCGAEVVEIDVRPTSDGVLVVLHDDNLERVTGISTRASSTPSVEILAQRFVKARGEGPILLDDALDLLCRGRAAPWVDIEIKDDPGVTPADLASRVATSWRRSLCPQRVVLTSTSSPILEAVGASLAELPRGLVFGATDERDPVATALGVGASVLVVDQSRIEESWTASAQRQRLAIWVYTVNDLGEATRLASRGFGIVTDDLPGLRKTWTSRVDQTEM